MPDTDRRRYAKQIARWQEYGVDAIKTDLVRGGFRLVGGSPRLREIAWHWVREKEAEREASEALVLKPNSHGIGVDLKKLPTALRTLVGTIKKLLH